MTYTRLSSCPAILQVVPALDTGGVERGTADMAAAIAGQGWRALVASSGGRLVTRLETAGAEHILLPLNRKTPVALWRNSHHLHRVALQHQVSLMHARSRAPAWSALVAARRLGIPFVTTYHGAYGSGSALKRAYNSVMARGDAVIAISGYIRDYILRHHPDTSPDRIVLIPRGVDLATFSPALVEMHRVLALRHLWQVPEGRRVILLPARPSRWKGIDCAIAALAGLSATAVGDNWHGVLLGCTGNRAAVAFEALARTAGIRDRLTFAPAIADMPAACLAADVVLSPSVKPEAFGRIPIEAQAMGRPVIACAHGGALETVREGLTGWLVPPGDVAALTHAIATAMTLTPEARQAMDVAGRQQAEQFSLAAMADATLRLYTKVLQSQRLKRI
jgi:glycosyltransferase involved in cell wall biosynthesis